MNIIDVTIQNNGSRLIDAAHPKNIKRIEREIAGLVWTTVIYYAI